MDSKVANRTINDEIDYLVWSVTKVALNDDLWKLFYLKSLPHKGAFFRRFENKEKLAKEDFLMKEFHLWSIIDIVEAVKRKAINEDDQWMLITGLLGNVAAMLSEMPFLGLNTSRLFISYIRTGFLEYFGKTGQDFLRVFVKRAERSVSKADRSRLLVSCSFFIANMTSPRIYPPAFYTNESTGEHHKVINGYVLDRDILAQNIKMPKSDIKMNWPLDEDELSTYIKFSYALLKNNLTEFKD